LRVGALESSRIKIGIIWPICPTKSGLAQTVLSDYHRTAVKRLSGRQQEIPEHHYASHSILLDIINEHLGLSKIEAASITFDRVAFQLRDIVEKSHGDAAPAAHDKTWNLRLNMVYNDVTQQPEWGRPLRLKQIIYNLLRSTADQ